MRWLQESKDGDLKPLIGMFIQEQAKELATAAGWDTEVKLAEAYRLERFAGLEPLFQMMGEPLEHADPALEQPELDQTRG